ncbi:MAG TPA: hypothetical protein VMT89_01055 [Candidatus Acidoferrales bacterium]|nr:hypothetical protein [Candidatus Acidoferrales bacterium]
MPAEQLIALEAAVADIGSLYAVARNFVALQQRAEAELLPQLASLSSRLRRLVRRAELNDDELDDTARQIVAFGSAWRTALAEVRASAVYQQALAAYDADRQDDLRVLIPQIYAGLRAESPPRFCLPFSPITSRQRPGQSPFLSAEGCAAAISSVLETGMSVVGGGDEWWESELASVDGSDACKELETPIWLEIHGGEVPSAIFRVEAVGKLRAFTPCFRAPMRVGVSPEATDEWWQAYDQSYADFRIDLLQELRRRQVPLIE